MEDKPNARAYTPNSDFSRYENKQEKMDESQAKGKSVYVKGENKNGKEK